MSGAKSKASGKTGTATPAAPKAPAKPPAQAAVHKPWTREQHYREALRLQGDAMRAQIDAQRHIMNATERRSTDAELKERFTASGERGLAQFIALKVSNATSVDGRLSAVCQILADFGLEIKPLDAPDLPDDAETPAPETHDVVPEAMNGDLVCKTCGTPVTPFEARKGTVWHHDNEGYEDHDPEPLTEAS